MSCLRNLQGRVLTHIIDNLEEWAWCREGLRFSALYRVAV